MDECYVQRIGWRASVTRSVRDEHGRRCDDHNEVILASAAGAVIDSDAEPAAKTAKATRVRQLLVIWPGSVRRSVLHSRCSSVHASGPAVSIQREHHLSGVRLRT
jgi:hypothetical protein